MKLDSFLPFAVQQTFYIMTKLNITNIFLSTVFNLREQSISTEYEHPHDQ